MIDPKNPLRLSKSVDDSRLSRDEQVVLADTLHAWKNRHGVDPADMPSPEGQALLAAIGWGEAKHAEDIVAGALPFAAALGTEARERLQDMLAFAWELPEHGRVESIVAASAARLRRRAAIIKAETREAEALGEAVQDPTPETRRAYIEALQRTNEAHQATPMRRRSLSDMVEHSLQRMRDGQGRPCVGILTPLYRNLSNALFGWRGVVVLAAAPGLGKSTLALSAALDAVEANPDTCMLFASFEMPTATLVDRVLSQMSGVAQRALRVGKGTHLTIDGFRLEEDDVQGIEQARERLRRLQGRAAIVGRDDIGTLDGPAPSCMTKLAQMVEDLKSESGASRSFVVVDYLGILPVSLPGGAPFPNDTDRIRHALSGLVGMRDRLGEDNPVVVVAQARKSDWADAELSSVMGTADTVYSADAVIVLQRPKAEENEPMPRGSTYPIEARIVKGRDMMHYSKVPMLFDASTSELREADA